TVFRELLENAGSFTEAGGSISVGVTEADRDVLVRIQDSGPGIAEAGLGRVFERFFTTRGRARGTGLGLALLEAIGLAHGGGVHVESKAGRGALFEVRLPRGAA